MLCLCRSSCRVSSFDISLNRVHRPYSTRRGLKICISKRTEDAKEDSPLQVQEKECFLSFLFKTLFSLFFTYTLVIIFLSLLQSLKYTTNSISSVFYLFSFPPTKKGQMETQPQNTKYQEITYINMTLLVHFIIVLRYVSSSFTQL